ncbi:iron chelate uptake ABC transporter family permease subunit [Ornithinibacillus sp. L9]|uniref:Iron chelate uptake ABC transporter family permease subunit n=1 Tax=Ornithinibacillus caprae TaxID=2678566 RepID=A0A6N8FFL6_9BACI|nr:iron ABC transporter permease [Ornithinibacillus caprae]MUK88235.1 iron chelate uptake ABC transporter family permease subunit [Ornithinibacillus caprae]
MTQTKKSSRRNILTPKKLLVILPIVIILLSIISTGIGAVYIKPWDVFAVLIGTGAEMDTFIIENFRVPRIILALLIGSGLAVSGTILQGLVRNPLASPDVIGITKGAGLAAIIVIILFPKAPSIVLPVAAFAGAMVVAFILFVLVYKQGVQPTTLALGGVALGALCHAGIQYFMIKYPLEINAALIWLTGSLWSSSWEHIIGTLPWIIVLLPLTIFLAIKLDILNLGDDVAQGLGENVTRVRLLMLTIAVALAAACVAAVGSIGFVGLIAPHMARRLVGIKHKYLLPVSALIGSLLVVVADSIGRGLIPPKEIPVGIVIAVIGAPYFLYLLRRERNS